MATGPARPALRALRPLPTVVPPPAARAVRWVSSDPAGDPMTDHLRRLPYPRAGLETDVVVLPRQWPSDGVERLLRAYRSSPRHLTLVHHGAGGGSLLRGLAAADGRGVGTIALAEPTLAALNRAAGLLGAPTTHDEWQVGADGTVRTTGWEPFALPAARAAFGGATVLITGALGGLGSRLALALAAAGAVPVLVDARAPAEAPPGVRRVLSLLRRCSAAAQVRTADLTDPAAAAVALEGLRPDMIVHCAGRVAGGTGRVLTAADIDALIAAKTVTLRTVVEAVRTDRLRAVLTFGSLTAYGAHPDLADYALANELLRRATRRLAGHHRAVRCCTAEWSLWSGAGMARHAARHAARLLGMIPIPVTTGIAAATRLIGALAAGADVPESLLIMAERPGSQGAWSGRPEGVPGVETSLVVPAGGDLTAAMRTVAEAAAGAPVEPAAAAHSPAPLLVRAVVTGDQIDCRAEPVTGAGAWPHHTRYRLTAGTPQS